MAGFFNTSTSEWLIEILDLIFIKQKTELFIRIVHLGYVGRKTSITLFSSSESLVQARLNLHIHNTVLWV